MGKIKGVKKIVDGTLLLINFFFIGMLLLSYLSTVISPQKIWLLPFFGLAYPVILLLNMIFILIWIAKRRFLFIYSLVVIIFGWSHITNTFRINFFDREPDNLSNNFTFLSFNVRLFNQYNWIDDPSVKSEIYSFLLNEDPDILCIQEYFANHYDPFNQTREFRRLHNKNSHIEYSSSNNGNFNFGIATFSKYPIINKGRIDFANSTNIAMFSDIAINSDTIRVINCHLQSVQFSQKNINFIDSIGRRTNKESIEGILDIVKRLKNAYLQRELQVELIIEQIENSPYPVVVTGDFNDTPVSYAYRKLTRHDLDDAFISSGRGIGSSHISSIPLLRIDYIMHSKSLESFNFKMPGLILSDHYPLKSEFTFRR